MNHTVRFLSSSSSKGLAILFKQQHFCFFRYQDVHNQSYVMVMASGRWMGVRLDLLASLLVGVVALAAVVVSQDAGG